MYTCDAIRSIWLFNSQSIDNYIEIMPVLIV